MDGWKPKTGGLGRCVSFSAFVGSMLIFGGEKSSLFCHVYDGFLPHLRSDSWIMFNKLTALEK